MYAIKAIYDGVDFKPEQPIPVKGRQKVIITFLGPEEDMAQKRPRSEVLGLFKGKVWISDDFNEPLDELKEYME